MKHSGAEEQCPGCQELEVGGGDSGCGRKGVARRSPVGVKWLWTWNAVAAMQERTLHGSVRACVCTCTFAHTHRCTQVFVTLVKSALTLDCTSVHAVAIPGVTVGKAE